jgi:RNA polymerase sigma-70 factor, ECF subfamily
MPSPMTDEEIVARVCAGERQLFELLMRRHNQRVFRVVRAILRRSDEAEDVMQEAYIRAYDHLGDFRGEARFSTWLTRIAVHEALARSRKERRFESLESRSEDFPVMSIDLTHNPEQRASDVEVRAVLERAIDSLPEEFRLVFVMRAVQELSGAETAECLGIPEETVKTRLHRARKRLQENMLNAFDAKAPEVYDFHLSRCDRVVAGVMQRIMGQSHAP